MEKILYDVYDKEGNLIIEEMTSVEIAAALDTQRSNVSKRANDGGFLGGKYRIVRKSENRERKPEENANTVRALLAEKWADTVNPFKNVIWVDKYEPGVKRLRRV